MNRLEILYEDEVKKISFNVRKVNLKGDKIILKGPRHSGKTYLILDLLSTKRKESFLYIDFSDIRIDASIVAHLGAFLKKYPQIELLVLENLDFAFPLPKCKKIIITMGQKDFHLNGFDEIYLYPLDFEEYIAFDKKGLNVDAIFSSFANTGTFPQMLGISKLSFVQSFQHLLLSYYKTPTELEILKNYALAQSTKISVFSVFQGVKKSHKISKDRFYEYTQKLLNEEVIFLVEKFGQKSRQKKLYMIDFAIRGVLSFEKDFIRRFENMIFLELYKRGFEIFFIDIAEFYIPSIDTVVISLPFAMGHMIFDKLERSREVFERLELKNVFVITMQTRDSFIKNGISYEIMPFWNWAVGL